MAMSHRLFRLSGVAAVAFVACLGSTAVLAQAPPPGAGDIKRTVLQKFDVPGSNYETVIALVEIVPNGVIAKHTHFGIDSGVLQSGDLSLSVEGKSDALVVKAGDSWQIPPNTVHWGKAGPTGAKITNTYVVEKGKPLATPVP
jgi:quercetin dioxygenase-like cupin family protein